MKLLKVVLLSLCTLTGLSVPAEPQPLHLISNLPGYYLGVDTEALGSGKEVECQVLIRDTGDELTFFIKIVGKGVVKMSAVGALQLTDALERTTKFRQKHDPNIDQSRLTAVLYRVDEDDATARVPGVAVGEPGVIALGWRASDGVLTDIHVSEGKESNGARSLTCSSLKHFR